MDGGFLSTLLGQSVSTMAPKVNGEVAAAGAAPGIPGGAAAGSTSTGGGPGLWKAFLVDLLGDKAKDGNLVVDQAVWQVLPLQYSCSEAL